jgi:signal transduction histidine kinase
MLLLALLGGAFMGQRAVRPIRRLGRTMRSIIETGNVGERAPAPPARGEIAELYRLFDLTLERVEALVAGLRNTLDDVAHDVRTPLTRIRGAAEVALQDGHDADVMREALADVVEAAESASATLDAIIDVGEAEAGARRLRMEEVSVRAILDQVAGLYADVADDRHVNIVVEDPGPLVVTADRALLARVLANLIDNAVKYSPAGSTVTLRAAEEKDWMRLEVRDTGPGIAAADLPRIWDRHFRGDRSLSERGLGLGLSLVRAGAEAHGGQAAVESAEGQGATFTVRLRRHL